MSHSTAAGNVFSVAELLDLIIYQLDPAEQTTASQVCTSWHDLVKTSPYIQPFAFPWDRPVRATEFLVWKVEDDLDMGAPGSKTYQPRLTNKPSPSAIVFGRFNPVLEIHLKLKKKTSTDGRLYANHILSLKGDVWRKHLLVQPPVPISRFTLQHNTQSDLQADLSACEGTTLGDLHDLLKNHQNLKGGWIGMLAFRIERCLAKGVELNCLVEARRLRAEEIAEAKEVVEKAKTEAQEDREAIEAFDAVTADNWAVV